MASRGATVLKSGASKSASTPPRKRTRRVSPPLAVISPGRLETRRKIVARAFASEDQHAYFEDVAEARYVLRKVFRIVEEQAKSADLDPLAHQVLIQIYGSPTMQLRVNQIAERLDIAPAFASNLVRTLAERKLVSRTRGQTDQRAILVRVTESGRKLLHAIDDEVKVHVDYFTRGLTPKERESALSILMFYVGASMAGAHS
jgi:DNA-binding MarR family transcriptional regulator